MPELWVQGALRPRRDGGDHGGRARLLEEIGGSNARLADRSISPEAIASNEKAVREARLQAASKVGTFGQLTGARSKWGTLKDGITKLMAHRREWDRGGWKWMPQERMQRAIARPLLLESWVAESSGINWLGGCPILSSDSGPSTSNEPTAYALTASFSALMAGSLSVFNMTPV